MGKRDGQQGFTLVELMVALAVLAILTVAALPSFASFRQRSAVREAADQATAFWNSARFEAVKRNAMVKVSVKKNADGTFCLGAATTSDPSDAVACDCTAATPAANICNIARFPTDQGDWNGVTLATAASDTAVLEAKRGSLADAAAAGVLLGLSAPKGPMDYTLNMHVDAMGRAVICQSSADTDLLADYKGRQCSP
jgi:prepilin-type N-terminal cleavage/methylation domain-containing protein